MTLLLHFRRAMNNYRISLADSWHQEAQVIYETWQVILIKCRACGCKVAGREQILSRQRAAKRHALLQTRWAGLSGLPQLSCKPGPQLPRGTDRFQLEGEKAHREPPALPQQQTHDTQTGSSDAKQKPCGPCAFVTQRCTNKVQSMVVCFLSPDEGCHLGSGGD